ENKSSVDSVSGLAKAEQPQILPNHCFDDNIVYSRRIDGYVQQEVLFAQFTQRFFAAGEQ
ncbi:hypothetical protein, partial [Muribaculum sp.]|uniref:hypothetical protein n=1 Tax=Muribaculum sp. TaxID=1918611 RepID=UPI003745FE33